MSPSFPSARIAFFLLLVIICSGVVFGAEGAAPRLMPATLAPRHVVYGQSNSLRIPIQNSSAVSIDILEITTGCDCLKVVSFPPLLMPGEEGEVMLVHKPEVVGDWDTSLVVEAVAGEHSFVSESLYQASVDLSRYPDKLAGKYLVEAAALPLLSTAVLIDTRRSRSREQFSLASVVVCDAFKLQSQLQYRSRPVILIGDGIDQGKLLYDAQRLTSLGWSDVRVLIGGAKSLPRSDWSPNTSLAKGESPAVQHIGTGDFLRSLRELRWIVVDVSSVQSTPVAFSSEIAESAIPVFHAPKGGIASDSLDALASAVVRPGTALLISGSDGTPSLAAEQLLSQVATFSSIAPMAYVLQKSQAEVARLIDASFTPPAPKILTIRNFDGSRRFSGNSRVAARRPCGGCGK